MDYIIADFRVNSALIYHYAFMGVTFGNTPQPGDVEDVEHNKAHLMVAY